MKYNLSQSVYKNLLSHLFIVIIVIVFFVCGCFDLNEVNIVKAKEVDKLVYLDPVDTAFTVEEMSDYTPVLSENLQQLEESLFFSQAKKTDYLDKKLAKNNYSTQKTQLEREYVVQDGDTITDIADKFNMHVGTIYERNNLNADMIESIRPGDVLTIPAYDTNDSQQWLAELNDKKEEERLRLLEFEEQKKQEELASQLAAARSVYTREYSYSSGRTTEVNTSGYNGYPYGWCTYYVASRRNVPSNWGNAGQWLGSAQSAGYATGGSPSVGAILVTGESWWGHVAIVEAVNGNQITVSEMNYSGWGVTSSRTISTSNPVIKGYIY